MLFLTTQYSQKKFLFLCFSFTVIQRNYNDIAVTTAIYPLATGYVILLFAVFGFFLGMLFLTRNYTIFSPEHNYNPSLPKKEWNTLNQVFKSDIDSVSSIFENNKKDISDSEPSIIDTHLTPFLIQLLLMTLKDPNKEINIREINQFANVSYDKIIQSMKYLNQVGLVALYNEPVTNIEGMKITSQGLDYL